MSPLSLDDFRKLVNYAEQNGILSLFNQPLQDHYYRPDGDEDTAQIPAIEEPPIDDESDTQKFPIVPDNTIIVITIVAHGAEGERSHPAPCGYPEYLCSCYLQDAQ